MVDSMPFTQAPSWRVLTAGVIWILVYLAARFVLEANLAAHPWDLAIAFPATMLLLMTLGLLSTLPSDPIVTPRNKIWVMLPPLYGVCVAIANWRYR